MARLLSRGSGVGACQSSKPFIHGQDKAGARALWLAPQSLWVLRLAITMQIGVVVCIWPLLVATPAIAAVAVAASVLLAAGVLLMPVPPQSSRNFVGHDDRALTRNLSLEINNQQAETRPGVRRNRPFVRAQVAPDAAPRAVLARDLDPKARAWADLMARISHDLRTPLNAVIGFSDLMQQEAFGPLGSPRYQEYARHIQDCGTALLKSTEDTLAMTCALSGGPPCEGGNQKVDLEELVHDVWSALAQRAASHSIVLEVDVPVGLEIHFERTALRQILLNLICDGLSHVSDGGQLCVRATVEDGRVELGVSSSEPPACSSSDSLALCVARTLLNLHGGSLFVVHDCDQGWRAVTHLELARQHDFFVVASAGLKALEISNGSAVEAA